MSVGIKNNEVKDIIGLMRTMIKSYGTYENYDRLVFTMTPDYYNQYQKANFESAIDAGIIPSMSIVFMGISIRVQEGESMIMLNCES